LIYNDSMLKPVDMDELEEKTYQLLEEVGIAVESEKLSEICLQQGCSPANGSEFRDAS
jgi:trimethylamine:corrinoid methyltransferase-like protein